MDNATDKESIHANNLKIKLFIIYNANIGIYNACFKASSKSANITYSAQPMFT